MKSSVLLAIGVGATAVIVLSVISAKQKKKKRRKPVYFQIV
ncbi:hypothetical protein M2132_000256 [Dysgonomonas sp. PH5-45]|nr:hypothetical protein [Dysgonomonas sp. PH5-45]MDH6386838.1 hypothetical protein [Dysgonomonas sp. PH5-37]